MESDKVEVVPGQVAGQAVHFPAGHVHVFRAIGHIEADQLAKQPRRMMRLDACLVPRLEKGLQPFVSETFDHG